MHRMLQVALLILVLAFAGCIAVGDGLLTIQGKLSAADSPSGCSLRLALLEETEARSYNTRAIKQEFFEDFTVAPRPRDYRITVSCPGYKPMEKTVHSTGSVTKVDLGTVALTR
jgi:hypothetical protein